MSFMSYYSCMSRASGRLNWPKLWHTLVHCLVKYESIICENGYRKFFAEHVCLHIFFNVDVINVLDDNRIAKKVKQFLFFLLSF